MHSSEAKAYAKINLFLEVYDRLENGYHNIDSIMQTVSLFDTLSVSYYPQGKGIVITCSDPTIPTDSSNIVYKCASAYLEYCHLSGGVYLHIEKNIPSQAGLGGGSADGAAVLRCLNKLCGYPVSTQELCKIGSKIGADIPFCIVGGAVRCRGIGDQFMPAHSLSPSLFLVIAKGNIGSNTAEAYKALDANPNRISYPLPHLLETALEKGDINTVADHLYNGFEPVIVPGNQQIADIKSVMKDHGSLRSLMSGSGTAVFGIFTDKDKAKDAAEDLKAKGYFAFVCNPVNTIE